MPKASENSFGYIFNNIFYDEDTMIQFDEFAKEYESKTDAQLYEAIEKTQAEVDIEIKKKHIKNLELIGQMEGFIDETTTRSINEIKKLIKVEETSSRARGYSRYNRRRVEAQFFSSSSLLLWFLLVTVLFRGSRFRRPFGFFSFRPYY